MVTNPNYSLVWQLRMKCVRHWTMWDEDDVDVFVAVAAAVDGDGSDVVGDALQRNRVDFVRGNNPPVDCYVEHHRERRQCHWCRERIIRHRELRRSSRSMMDEKVRDDDDANVSMR